MAIVVGSVAVDVVPDASKFATRLRAGLLPEASRVGDDVGRTIGDRVAARVRDALGSALNTGSRVAVTAGTRAGEDYGGSFARTVRTRIDAALRNLPKPQVGVNATELDAELADIRARMQALSDVKIGVDLQAADALAELSALQARLDELGARSPDIRIKVDAAAAAAELALVQAEVDKLDGKDIDVHVDDHGTASEAIGSLGALATTGIALGPAIIPVAGAVAAAVAGIGTAAVAGAAGIGVLFLGFSGIAAAVKQLGQSHAKTGELAARSAAQQVSSATAIASAEQQVADAHRGVADAERQASQSVQQALLQQQNAEQGVTDAVRAEKQALAELSAARQQAKQDIEDLTLQVQDGALAQRQALLDVQTAKDNLDKTLKNPNATQEQRAQAQLTYDEAVQQVTDLSVRQQRLLAQQQAATAAGVNGSAGVLAATQRISDTERALADARAAASRAQKAVLEAQRAGAERVLQAQERLVSAERSLAVAHAQAGAAAAAAYAKTGSALAALTPQGRAFARFINALRPELQAIRNAAQAGLLPGVQAAITALLPVLPGFIRFVGSLATTMGALFREAGQALTAPFWTQFFAFLSRTAGPNLVILARTVGNFITGLAGLFQAFAPVATQLGLGLQRVSEGFASFGTNASHSAAFQSFLAYLQKTGPEVARTLGALVRALGHVVEGIAPLGGPALAIIRLLSEGISKIPVPVLTALFAVLGPLVVALKAWALWQGIVNSTLITTIAEATALDAVPIVLIIVAIIAAVVLLVIGIIELVKHWRTVWATIRSVADAVFRFLKSAVSSVVGFFQAHWPLLLAIITGPIGLAVLFVVRHFDTIKAAATAVWTWVRDRFNQLLGFFAGLPSRISAGARGMWDGIKTAFRATIDVIIGWWDKFVSYLKIPPVKISVPIPGVPDINWGGVDLGKDLKIPFLAAGGDITGPSVVGERGPEIFIPKVPGTIIPNHDLPALLAARQAPLIGMLVQHQPTREAVAALPGVLRDAVWLKTLPA